jgi:nucleotide-binding universal stress UspA family protein
MFNRILIANNASESADRALLVAIKLAKKHDSDLHMVSVEEMPRFPTSVVEVVEEKAKADHVYEAAIRQAMAQAQAQGVKLTPHVVLGHPVPTISAFVANGRFDLLVIGHMGHSELYNRVIGSTTDRLMEHAPCLCFARD